MLQMLVAGALFVGTHLGISSTPARARLISIVGARGYLGLYSLCALATLGYLIWLYGAVPRYDYVWQPSPLLHEIPRYIMPLAFVLLLGGFMVKNPTNVGMEGLLGEEKTVLARGVTRITRHPFQWSVVLWAIGHLIANGDTVSIVFFSSFLLLSLIGTFMIDRKKEQSLGVAWHAYRDQTSNIPFAAILTGRNRLVLSELWLPLGVGSAGYFALFYAHEWIAGVRLI